jgi:hypothetical protein
MRLPASDVVNGSTPSTCQLRSSAIEAASLAGLRPVARDLQRAALHDACVDALSRGDVGDLVDRLVERPLPGHHGVAPVLAGHRVAVAGDLPGQPAAVAARRAESGEARLQHHDSQSRVGPLEVVGRPQSGVAGAHDADVGIAVARQRRPVLRKLVEPVRDFAVHRGGHRTIVQHD